MNEREIIAAKINGCHHRRGNEHIDVLCEEIETEFHATIFSMIPTHEFSLALRQIKWRPIGLGESTNQKYQERKRLNENIPMRSRLLLHNSFDTHRARNHNHRNNRQPHTDFITD